MNRRAWHLISTGHRPKDGASVICIFYSGEAISCYYNREFDDFIPYDQEWDMQPFHSALFKAWCFDNDNSFNILNAYDDFIKFSKEYGFPELLKSKKKSHISCDSELIDYRIRDLCKESVCISRLVWFHPSQTELRDKCVTEVMQSACDTHLIYGSNISPSYKTRSDFIKASFDAQCLGDSRFLIPSRVAWKTFFKCLIDRYLHNDTKDFMQCWSWDIDLLHFESAEQWECEMHFLAQEFAERIQVGDLTPYRMIVDLSDDMNNPEFSSDGDFFRGCFIALLDLTWYSLKDCLDIKVFCGSGVVPCCFDFLDASKLRHSEIHFEDLISRKKYRNLSK